MKRKCIVAGICAAVLLTACGQTGTADSEGGNVSTSSVAEIETETSDAAASYAESVSVPEYLTISTDYGDLYYPDQWEEFIQIDEEKEDESTTLFFKAVINSNEYELFDIQISGESDSESAGTLTAEDGSTSDIYISMKEIADTGNLTEGETDRLYAMQEDINYIIDNLK